MTNEQIKDKDKYKGLGTKVEIKNINSFEAMGKVVDVEILRQSMILELGGKIVQVTQNHNELVKFPYNLGRLLIGASYVEGAKGEWMLRKFLEGVADKYHDLGKDIELKEKITKTREKKAKDLKTKKEATIAYLKSKGLPYYEE